MPDQEWHSHRQKLEFKYKSIFLPGFSIRRLLPDHVIHVNFPILFEYLLMRTCTKWIYSKIWIGSSLSSFLLKQVNNNKKWRKRHTVDKNDFHPKLNDPRKMI